MAWLTPVTSLYAHSFASAHVCCVCVSCMCELYVCAVCVPNTKLKMLQCVHGQQKLMPKQNVIYLSFNLKFCRSTHFVSFDATSSPFDGEFLMSFPHCLILHSTIFSSSPRCCVLARRGERNFYISSSINRYAKVKTSTHIAHTAHTQHTHTRANDELSRIPSFALLW